MPFTVHVGGTAQVLEPVLVQDQETVSKGHVSEWVALAGVATTRQGDVFVDVHAYIVQQTHVQRNESLSKVKFRVLYIFF
jgi:hypothetical protein